MPYSFLLLQSATGSSPNSAIAGILPIVLMVAIFYFLVFMPGRSGVNNIIGKAAAIQGAGKNDAAAAAIASAGATAGNDGESERFAKKLTSIAAKGRFVVGAISDPTGVLAV